MNAFCPIPKTRRRLDHKCVANGSVAYRMYVSSLQTQCQSWKPRMQELAKLKQFMSDLPQLKTKSAPFCQPSTVGSDDCR